MPCHSPYEVVYRQQVAASVTLLGFYNVRKRVSGNGQLILDVGCEDFGFVSNTTKLSRFERTF